MTWLPSSPGASLDFDLRALRVALDARRTALGLTWEAVGIDIGVSAAALRGLGTRQAAEGDGVVRVLAWLRRSAESFTTGEGHDSGETWSPPAAPRALRFDTRALYRALDAARAARGQTWREVALASGMGSAASLTRLRAGGRVMFPAVMHAFAWLGVPAARFVRAETP